MATFGQMFRAVVAENDPACVGMGWEPLHVTRGFKPEDSVVTITSVRTSSDPFSTAGESAERHLDLIVDWVKRMIEPYQSSRGYVESHVLLLTPAIRCETARRSTGRTSNRATPRAKRSCCQRAGRCPSREARLKRAGEAPSPAMPTAAIRA